MIGNPPMCLDCKHYRAGSAPMACEAFPEGIPDDIIHGRYVHDIEYPGDHGIVFEKREIPIHASDQSPDEENDRDPSGRPGEPE